MTEILDTMTAPKFKSIDQWLDRPSLRDDLLDLVDELKNQKRDPVVVAKLERAVRRLDDASDCHYCDVCGCDVDG